MGKRRTKNTAQRCIHFCALKDPDKFMCSYFLTAAMGHKKTGFGFAELRPFLLYGLSCRVDLDF